MAGNTTGQAEGSSKPHRRPAGHHRESSENSWLMSEKIVAMAARTGVTPLGVIRDTGQAEEPHGKLHEEHTDRLWVSSMM